MKISKIKVLSLILTVIVISAIILSCGDNNDSGVKNDDSPAADSDKGAQNVNEPDEAEKLDSGNSVGPRPDYDLPERDLNKYNFRIISRSEEANIHWYNYET